MSRKASNSLKSGFRVDRKVCEISDWLTDTSCGRQKGCCVRVFTYIYITCSIDSMKRWDCVCARWWIKFIICCASGKQWALVSRLSSDKSVYTMPVQYKHAREVAHKDWSKKYKELQSHDSDGRILPRNINKVLTITWLHHCIASRLTLAIGFCSSLPFTISDNYHRLEP